jgi:uncharacterized protein YjbI with pentapeptide repeats
LLNVILAAPAAHADIFQWEYINPADPSQGKRQSTTLCPDGAGVDAVPGANLSNRNLTMAYLIGADFGPYYFFNGSGYPRAVPANLASADFTAADLRGANFAADARYTNPVPGANLASADFTAADLRGANFVGASLDDANFTAADIQGASFNVFSDESNTWERWGGLTLAQLYSTASYQAHDLSGVGLGGSNLSGANFSGFNLTGANLNADLTGADFTGAEVRGASLGGITLAQLYSTATYATHDLSGLSVSGDLSGANFSGFNLTGATLGYNLARADFTNANLTGANLGGYPGDNLVGADFTNANLTGANLHYANLTGADFTNANLTDAYLYSANLTGADFTGADVRGATFDKSSYGTGITLAQLYSTASYQAHDLSGVGLQWNNLAGANFAGQNLTNADFGYGTLTGADFRDANLANTSLGGAILTDADFTGTDVRGATFYPYYDHNTSQHIGGITLAQIYSTASYQAHDLSGIILWGSNLAGANFAGQNFTNASLSGVLTGADFTNAEVRGAFLGSVTLAQLYSTSSYQAHDLSGISLGYNNLAGANFVGQNLTNADLGYATLTGADFTDAKIRGASFDEVHDETYDVGTGITLAQLYSTASYQAHDLSGISLRFNNLAGANFAGQNLTNASFRQATLTGADFTAADVRGTSLYFPANAITTNLIRPDGHINGLVLDGGGLLVVRDYDGRPEFGPSYPPIPITVDEHMTMRPRGTLRTVFEADAWDSTISFAPGIPVTLGGTLELAFAADVIPASQVGRTFDLFDWTGVTPTGDFFVNSPYAWDLANLYTTGEITLTAVPESSSLLPIFLGVFVINQTLQRRST